MKNYLLSNIVVLFCLWGIVPVFSQENLKGGEISSVNAVTLDSTNLPIIAINTNFQTIPDEPKITADMAIIDNGYNVTNHVTDTNYTYFGKIGIEMRGSISQSFLWPQKSYNIETRDSLGGNNDVYLMGMPKESDWVLYGPYDDHALMRNVLTYDLARKMGYWASRTRYCELLLKTAFTWNYKGVYVMMEKIKRDNDRVDISKLDIDDNAGDSLTGGYIIAVDQNINKPDSGWFSAHPQNANVFYTYKYPKGDEITPQQKTYIQAYVDSFENSMSSPGFADPVTGYRKYIEPVSFMDFFFMQELSKNIDAYKRSGYMYKDKYSKGGKFFANPHWDYNSAWQVQLGGCEPFASDTGWTYPLTCWVNQSFPVPFWWTRFLQDTTFTHDLKCRWLYLRSSVLDTVNIFHTIDSITNYISSASVRQFSQYNIVTTLQADVDVLKTWIRKRLIWLDANMPGNCWDTDVNEDKDFEDSFSIYPNPIYNGAFKVQSSRFIIEEVEIYDAIGNLVLHKTLNSKFGTVNIDGDAGIYFLKIKSENFTVTKKIASLE